MKKEDMEKRVFTISIVIVLIIAILIFWHPWINKESANESFGEFYGMQGEYNIELTDWNPFGQEFEVRTKDNIEIGHGLINIWGDLVEFEFAWE